MTDEELRARLLAEVEQVLNDRLAEKPVSSQMRLADIERWVLRTGQEVQARLLKEVARASQEAQSGEAPVCEGCGSRMQRRGMRPRQVVTEAGEMTLERAYYVCPGCGARLFPPG
jgi:DNA-directed RNA polymerase subunit RPC12/RpoP